MTPVRNEAWILERFLQCASTWADYIVIADQQSTDGSREIARRFEKVVLVDNPHDAYDEGARQQLLIQTARELPVQGQCILIALDADEMFSANWMESKEWQQLLSAPPGTVLYFQWANIGPNVSCAWIDPSYKPFGFVDDGSPHRGRPIHSPRVPVPEDAPALYFHEIKVLHYQYADWARMRSKQRWYQVWEALHHPEKRPVTIFRQYHHMEAAIRQAGPVRSEWLAGYEALGIDMRSIPKASHYYWDEEVLKLLVEHGPERFRKLNIWDQDWGTLAARQGLSYNGQLRDPRTPFEKTIHAWLRATQGISHKLPVRAVQKLLQLFGW
ncbi:Glycosyl transferase family 2 [Rhodothermus profundi]|uniref:Glycosyl transferase family 2 n=2 Tax=Rhodothermus profundi TaxID=633813 RepID=A0A1M6XJS2_9BACT|nr:Glycosyl transferase family 2 [Rhodothermus profundi]